MVGRMRGAEEAHFLELASAAHQAQQTLNRILSQQTLDSEPSLVGRTTAQTIMELQEVIARAAVTART